MSLPSLEAVLSCQQMASLPMVALEVLELTRDQNVSLSEIAVVVQNDPALTAKILRTVNSSFYGLSKPCPTISRALTYLGLSTVKSLVLGFSLVHLVNEDEGAFDYQDFWQRSLYSAAVARRIAQMTGRCDPEEAFIAALMQDVGMLAINAAASARYIEVIEEAAGDHHRLCRIERKRFGFDHAEVGARLGERWRLPTQLIETIAHHHDPRPTRSLDLVRTVSLGCQTAGAFRSATPEAALASLRHRANEWFRLNPDDISELMKGITDDARELSRLLQVNAEEPPDVNRILAEAENAALQHQLWMQRERDKLQKTNSELVRAATTDGLTKVGNRKRFDDELATRFEQAASFKGSLGLILLDADRFKRLNDTYGHQVGDAVLVELARRLNMTIRTMDLVCRYGGEEFGVVLPGANVQDVAAIAERLRLIVGKEPFELDTVKHSVSSVEVTISLGAAVYDTETAEFIGSAETLLHAADKALYAAKQGGRNCVRVFRPSPRSEAA